MSDETRNSLYMSLVNSGKRKFRRKRKHDGESWEPKRLFAEGEEIASRGIYCPSCVVIHPYNGKGKLGSSLDRRGDIDVILWLCPNTLNAIGELALPLRKAAE